MTLLCFIEQVNRFADTKQMATFFGVQPRLKASGDVSYKPKISKQGAGLVRRELYLIAFRTLQNEPCLRAVYEKQPAKGMSHDAALGVLMHKLCRIIYGMLSSGSVFDASIDQFNQHQTIPSTKKEEPQKDLARRFQQPSLDAPLSRRQRRERKKNYEPQADGVSASAGSS
ncbi:MAG: IS110 family transposase [Lewinellaceae bacterium]|nr:IS110 family transposase [Lewinellaceae bacterium]